MVSKAQLYLRKFNKALDGKNIFKNQNRSFPEIIIQTLFKCTATSNVDAPFANVNALYD